MLYTAKNIELLAPAGSPEALDAAVGEGADAVYLGLKNFNARLRSANFSYGQFEAARRSLHRMGKKIYVTVNTVFEQREADRMYQLLKYLADAGPDAIIVQDFGVIAMARSEFPSLKLHASTQMNIASGRGANALSRHDVSRVVLARELCLEELQGIRAETNLELEVFVHGALCICASGLCLFSSYLGGKSANRGMCTQACRRLYSQAGSAQTGGGESGYYFSPGDLQLLERLPDLAAAGINAFKIEGRMKSAEYVGTVVSAYRLVIDAIIEGNEENINRSIKQGQKILINDFARSKTRFYFDGINASPAGWLNPAQDGGTGISLGAILKVKGEGGKCRALVSPPQGLIPAAGDSVRLHRSDDSERVSHKLNFAEPAGDTCWISIPEGFRLGDRVYLIQTKAMVKRYTPVIQRSSSGRGPGRDKAPSSRIKMPKTKNRNRGKNKEPFPEGLYVVVSNANDLYIVQSSRPARVMLSYTRKNAAPLLSGNKPLPFKPGEIILVLDPYFPQGLPEGGSSKMAEEIGRLIEKGYRQYVVNNPGHFSLFRGKSDILLIAGPWLYTFNAWSLSFVASLGADGFISPLENNRQNLERTLETVNQHDQRLRSRFFITVFGRPSLFRIRTDLGQIYKFSSLADNREEIFSLVTDYETSFVYPEKPFSITDKIPFLKESGFARFIVDLSGAALKKSYYRDLIRMITDGKPLSNVSRFNWKDGFFQQKEQEAGVKPASHYKA
ncbi:MAG: U32 family peptidase [Treponema sp.]|nr:U32 family peptidase [Treponema sp.]